MAKSSFYVELDSGINNTQDPKTEKSNRSWATNLFLQGSDRINDRYSTNFEFSGTVTNVPSAEVGGTTASHDFFRVNLNDKRLVKLSDELWLGATYRYTPPTTAGAQVAGTYGSVMFRPNVTFPVGPVKVLVRNGVTLNLVRSGYAENLSRTAYVKAVTAGKADQATFGGVTLVSNAFEVIPQWEITKELSSVLAFGFGNRIIGKSKGVPNLQWGRVFYYQWDVIAYSSPLVFDSGVAFRLTHEQPDYTDFNLFDRTTQLSLVLSRSF
jgi:hypothetical protein